MSNSATFTFLDISDSLFSEGKATFQDNVRIFKTLSVGGNTTLYDLHVGGETVLQGLKISSLEIEGSMQGADASFSGKVNVNQTLSIGNDLTINGNLVVVGNSTKVNIESDSITIGDNMIKLNANTVNSSGKVPNIDFGFYGQTTIGGKTYYAV